MIFSTKGNASFVSLGITSMLLVAAAGAGTIITSTVQQSPKVVNAGKALFAAEGAIESALYEASDRGSGYIVTHEGAPNPGDPGYIPMEHINKTNSQWETDSRTESSRERNIHIKNDRILFIPPRQIRVADNESGATADDHKILSLEKNWKAVNFGASYTFDLFVDNAEKYQPLPLGGAVLGTQDESGTCIARNLAEGDVNCIATDGMTKDDTKSLFNATAEDDFHTTIEDVFIDLFIPNAKYPLDIDKETINESQDYPLLTWSIEAQTSGDGDYPPVLVLEGLPTCNFNKNISTLPFEENEKKRFGGICKIHFDKKTNTTFENNGIELIPSEDHTKDGLWVRLNNPVGIIATSKGKYFFNLKDYLNQDFSFDESRYDMNMTTTENISPTLSFPKLKIKFGIPQKWEVEIEDRWLEKEIHHAFVRIGIQYSTSAITQNANIFQQFPIPDDKVRIRATGEAGNYTQKINVDIQPQEVAPMFDYVIFQP